jgi:PEP-CTERM/exosortase A-associated glycosyltransferase
MSLRILHVLDHSIPLHSGYSFRTLAILREQRRLGWRTFHLTSAKHTAGFATEEDVEGWHFYRTPGSATRSRWPGMTEFELMRDLEARLYAVVDEVKPDLIHAHSPVLNALPALRVGKRLRIPVVYEVRGFWEDAAVDHGTTKEGSLRYRISRAMETYAINRAQHVTTICEGLRQDIVGRGVAQSKVTVIPNAVDVDEFEVGGKPDAALRERLGLGGAIVVGFVGSFYAYEGLDLLLTSLPTLLRRRPEMRLLLVGGGPQESALKAQAKALGVDDKVVFTGRVPHGEVSTYYHLIDILIYPRHSMRLTELVTPLKPLEGMAHGPIVVASDVGGHREMVRHGENGILFEADNADALSRALLDLIDDRARWPQLRAAGREYVEAERTWRSSVAGYVAPYEALLRAPPRPAA